MDVLNNSKLLETLDTSNMLLSVKNLASQCEQAWYQASLIVFPESYKNCKNCIIVGMGGSALGAQIVLSLFENKTTIPLSLISGFYLPSYVSEQTLVIIASNSGETKETIACFLQAEEKKCCTIVLSSGGIIATLAKEKKCPSYLYEQTSNPIDVSQMAMGYGIFSIVSFLTTLGFLVINKNDFLDTFEQLPKYGEMSKSENPIDRNPAKTLALSLSNFCPILVGSEFLSGSMQSFSCLLHENAKQLAFYFFIPELNHHLLEGLVLDPQKASFIFLFINSELYPERIQHRMKEAQEMVTENHFKSIYLTIEGRTPLAQACNLLQLGMYTSLYVRLLHISLQSSATHQTKLYAKNPL